MRIVIRYVTYIVAKLFIVCGQLRCHIERLKTPLLRLSLYLLIVYWLRILVVRL